MTPESPIAISAKQINKSFDGNINVLSNLDLEVAKGSSCVITGPSGSGKSSLLHILGTIDTPTNGSLQILGKDASLKNSALLRKQHIGFIFQAFHLLEDETVLYNVLLPAQIARKKTHPKSKAHTRALELIERVGLSHRTNHLAKHLSGGEKARVSIARALINDPELILADEPTGNLDPKASDMIYDLLTMCVTRDGKTLVAVTHDPNFVTRCSKHYRLEGGRLV